jgi:hypothetical protein
MDILFQYFIELPKPAQSLLSILYFIIIPLAYKEMWDNETSIHTDSHYMSYLRWYFLHKSIKVNWVGHITVIMLGLGSLVWWLI